MRKTYSGYNKNTAKHLILGAGAVYVNYDVEKPFEEQQDKLLGATSGGNTFEAVPEYREIEVDGATGRAKGLTQLNSWEVTLTTNMLEFHTETYKRALSAVETEEVELNGVEYEEIRAKNYVTHCDYLDNVTLIAPKSGSNDPVIIQLLNVISTDGLSVDFADGDDITAEITFVAHYDDQDLDNPPFRIYEPKKLIEDEDCEEPEEPGK